MNPTFAFVTHDPLFTVVCGFKINLFTIEAIKLFFVLFNALRAEVFYVVFVVLIIFSIFKKGTDLVAAYIGATPEFRSFWGRLTT